MNQINERWRLWCRGVSVVALSLLLGLGAGCSQGTGSDIGPNIPMIPSTDYRALVLDDANRQVTNAGVSITSTTAVAASDRSGRAISPDIPSGFQLVTIDGSNASATDGDALGRVVIGVQTPTGNQLPFVVFLPNLSNSVGLPLTVGSQPGSAVLDDSATSGAIVTVPAGTSVGLMGATTLVLRSGGLGAGHLPGSLPPAASGARLNGSAVLIDPGAVTFSPGAQLSMPNDLGLAPNGMADLFHLDPTTGVWGRVGMGTVDASGTRIATPPGTVTVAGLYAFATTILTTTTVSGSVVDPLGQPIQGVMVRVPGANTVTMSDGSYVLAPIATTDAAGMPRDVVIEAHGGRDRMPVMTTSNVTLSPGTNQVGDLSLAAEWVSIFLVQMINQGEVQPGRRVRVSGNTGLQRAVGVTDASGQVSFVNQSANGYTGLLTTRLLDADSVDLTQAAIFVGAGTHSTSLQVFSQMQGSWTPRSGGGPTATYVVDREGTGPVANAAVVQGDVPQQGYVGLTPDSGAISGTYGDVGQATASIATSAGGVAVVSAFTMVDINSARIELPLLRATEPTGAFDSHGLVCGTLQSAGSGTHQVRATRTISIDDWYDEVFFDLDVEGDVPIKVDPAVTGGLAFRIGVPLPSGNLVGLELTAGSNGPALDRFGFVAGLQPVAGGEIDRDLMLEYVPDTQFRISDALTNLSSTIAPATLTFDLALGLASGEFVDVARGIGGNMSASGTNLDLTLPALSGALAGGTYYVALHGTSITGGKVVSQQTFTPLDGSTSPYVRFLDVPDIVSPAPGATVSATGFTVQFTIPISTLYTLIELRAVGSSDERVWSAVLPASIDSFTFRELPPESPQPITPGLTWELKVTAARIETGPLSTVPDAYTRVTENWVGLSAAEQQVNAYSSTAITVTTN